MFSEVYMQLYILIFQNKVIMVQLLIKKKICEIEVMHQ